MSDESKTATQGGNAGNLRIPTDIARSFQELIDLIIHSESMNDEERQYWIDILPVMTPDQVTQLKDILQNERKQLAEIDAKYEKEIERTGSKVAVQQMEEERRSKNEQRSTNEATARAEEEQKADQILKNIE